MITRTFLARLINGVGLEDALHGEKRVVRVSETLVEFDDVEGDKLVQIKRGLDDLTDLLRLKAFRDSGACAVDELGVKRVNIEADVDGAVERLHIVDEVGNIEDTDVVLVDRLSFKGIDVADAAVRQLLETKLAQVHATGPVLLLHACADGEWRAVGVA